MNSLLVLVLMNTGAEILARAYGLNYQMAITGEVKDPILKKSKLNGLEKTLLGWQCY